MKEVPCNLCKGDNSRLLFIKNSIKIVKCLDCGLIYVNPRPSERELKEKYNAGYFDGSEQFDYLAEKELYLHRFEERIRQVNSLKPEKGRLLDIGCAVGYFLEIARKEGWETFGVEISPFASRYARNSGLNIFTGTTEEAKYNDGYFDVVTLWHVLEHTEDPSASLEEVHRILKKSGLVAVELPNAGSRKFKKQGESWEHLKPTEHLYYFTPDVLRKIVEKTGFEIVKMEAIPSGTEMGKKLERFKLIRLKERLIRFFPYLRWAKKIMLNFKKMAGSDDAILVFARKR